MCLQRTVWFSLRAIRSSKHTLTHFPYVDLVINPHGRLHDHDHHRQDLLCTLDPVWCQIQCTMDQIEIGASIFFLHCHAPLVVLNSMIFNEWLIELGPPVQCLICRYCQSLQQDFLQEFAATHPAVAMWFRTDDSPQEWKSWSASSFPPNAQTSFKLQETTCLPAKFTEALSSPMAELSLKFCQDSSQGSIWQHALDKSDGWLPTVALLPCRQCTCWWVVVHYNPTCAL